MKNERVDGVDFLKFLGVLAMLGVHTSLVMTRILKYPLYESLNSWTFDLFLMIGFFSAALPALAGTALRRQFESFFVGTKLVNFNVRSLVVVAFILMFFEGLKNALSHGALYAFNWDVLHFISLSLIIIAVVSKYRGSRWVLPLGVVCLAGGSLAPYLWQSEGLYAWVYFVSAQISKFAILFGPTAFLYWLLVRVIPIPKSEVSRQLKFRRPLAIIIGVLITMSIILRFGSESMFYLSTESLPLSVFIMHSKNIVHLWPLFPWFFIVAWGFWLEDQRARSPHPRKHLQKMFGISGALFVVFSIFGFQSYRDLMVEGTLFSAKYFTAPATVVLGLSAFYAFLYSGSILLFEKVKSTNKIILNTSRGILFFYFLHFILAYRLAPSLDQLWGSTANIFLFPITIGVLTYLGMLVFLAFFRNRFVVNVRRKS